MDTYTIISIIAAAFVIWALISISQSKLKNDQKILWFFIVIFLPILGPILYYFVKVK